MLLAHVDLIWTTTRAAGIAALVFASMSMILGLSMGAKMNSGPRTFDVRTLHQTLATATIVALALHVVTLLLDTWLKPSISGLLVPFTMGYRPIWTGLGTLAAYGLIVFGMSGYLRNRIGLKRWKVLHRFTALTWVLAVAHTLGSGSDIGALWMTAILVTCVVPVVLLIGVRLYDAAQKPQPRQRARQQQRTTARPH